MRISAPVHSPVYYANQDAPPLWRLLGWNDVSLARRPIDRLKRLWLERARNWPTDTQIRPPPRDHLTGLTCRNMSLGNLDRCALLRLRIRHVPDPWSGHDELHHKRIMANLLQ